jgi:hypothetical protein
MCDARSRRKGLLEISIGAQVSFEAATAASTADIVRAQTGTLELVRDVVSSIAAPQSSTASRSSSGAPPGPSQSRRALELACAASSAEPAITEKSYPHVLGLRETRDEALLAEWRQNAREDEQT